MTAERLRKLRRATGYVAFGVVAFVLALMVTFPYERAKERVIGMMAERNLDVEIKSASPTLGVGMTMNEITVRTRPQPPNSLRPPSGTAESCARVKRLKPFCVRARLSPNSR